MAENTIFTDDFKEQPYWWDAVGNTWGGNDPSPLPKSIDVLIIGGGLTGVCASYVLARAGRSVLVLDAGTPGKGASSRNAGMLGRYSKHSFTDMMEVDGLDTARSYYRELNEVYRQSIARIEDNGLDCDLRKTGRFVGALSQEHFHKLAKEYELRAKYLGEEVRIIPASEQFEIGSNRYHGGVHIVDNASIQPARHYEALRKRAEMVGARIVGHTPVVTLDRDGKTFRARTASGSEILARDVIVATNGYSGPVTPWITKRLAPINAYIMATEPLSDNVINSILPNRRAYADNRRSTNSMMVSPDGKRLLMGGRTGEVPRTLKERASEIYSDMLFFFPDMRGVKISHIWTGRCAATWDVYPRTGSHNGVHYALGYCFSGNAMAPYLGEKTALRILGSSDAKTIWERDRFPKVPWVARQSWAMTTLMSYYRWADRPEPVQ